MRIMRVVGGGILVMLLLANVRVAAEMKHVTVLYARSTENVANRAVEALEQAGFVDQQNIVLAQVMAESEDQIAEATAQIQLAPPDVILSFIGPGQIATIVEGLSIPVITSADVDRHVDADGIPIASITGVHVMPPDIVYNSYKFLQRVAPLKAGQHVIFLENRERSFISKEVVEDALHRLQIPLKAIVDATVLEDWKQAILQYNEDPDVGWILSVTGPTKKRDGSPVSRYVDALPWQREHLKKPAVAYFESRVREGALCGFATDLDEVGIQCGELAVRVLQGEDVRTIKAEYPRKVSVSLNRKTATNLGIVFSIDVLNLADIIYDDYEGKQVIRK
jgi:putative ABC transport system substrate-binding protein